MINRKGLNMEEVLTQILTELQSLNQRVGGLEQGQQQLKQELKADIKKVENKVDKLESRTENLEHRMENLENKTDRIDSGLLKLESRMENEVIDKIRSLYDDRSVNQDYFASIRNNQARIEEKLDILVHRAIRQDQKLDEHDRELRLLRIEKR